MKTILRLFFVLIFPLLNNTLSAQFADKIGAVRVVVAGTSHGHSAWILNKAKSDEMEIVGIYEPDKALAKKMPLSIT